MVAYVPLLLALIGLMLYILPVNPKINQIGMILFACGVLVTMFAWSGHSVKILP